MAQVRGASRRSVRWPQPGLRFARLKTRPPSRITVAVHPRREESDLGFKIANFKFEILNSLNRIGNEGNTSPVNRSSLEVTRRKNWHDIKVQYAAFAVAKA